MKKVRSFKHNSRSATLFICLFLAYPLLHLAVFTVYVNVDTLLLSFQRVDVFGNYRWNGIQNFVALFRDFGALDKYRDALVNSLWLWPVNLLILTPVSVLFAYYLYKEVWGAGVFRVIFFFPSVISVVALTMSFRFMLDIQYGPVPEVLRMLGLEGLIPAEGFTSSVLSVSRPVVYFYCVWAGIGYNIVLMQGAITRIPDGVIESARLDGAGMFAELTRIIIPLIFPTLATVILVSSTAPFTIFLQPKLLTGDNGMKTLALLIVDDAAGTPTAQIRSATLGLVLLAVGTPVMLGIRKLLDKLTPEVDF